MDRTANFSECLRVSKSSTLNIELLHGLVDIVPVGAMLVDNCGYISFSNHELACTLGYNPESLPGKNIETLLPEEFRSRHHTYFQQFFRSPEKREMGKGRKLFALHQDGRKIPIEIGLTPIQSDDSIWVLATLVDISPRLHADNILRDSISSTCHGGLIVDSKGIIHLVNRSLCECFGYDETELIDQPVEMLLPHRYRDNHHHLRDSFYDSPEVRKMGVGRDLTALHSNGREFPVEIGLSPIKDTHGKQLIQITLMDITERKRMELELRNTNANLEEFTYVASHDLRSPLRGIADLLDWIKEDINLDEYPSVQKNLARITTRVERMERLIENLLTYARAGRAATSTETVEVQDLLDDVYTLIDIPKSFRLKQDIQLSTLNSVRVPLETVLRNLISNAIKHHHKESGNIQISCKPENNFCHFAVSDDGPGIPEAAFNRIFRLFQTATSAERMGSGIGLSVSRRLAETHGGRISVTPNSPKPGVTFHLWWPRFLRTDTHD